MVDSQKGTKKCTEKSWTQFDQPLLMSADGILKPLTTFLRIYTEQKQPED